jgi:hypothetical protein
MQKNKNNVHFLPLTLFFSRQLIRAAKGGSDIRIMLISDDLRKQLLTTFPYASLFAAMTIKRTL